MKFLQASLLLFFLLSSTAFAQSPSSPAQLLEKSIQYHDSGHKWWTFNKQLSLSEIPSEELVKERGKFKQDYTINLYKDAKTFGMDFVTEEKKQVIRLNGDDCKLLENGMEVDTIKTGLSTFTCPRISFWRDYLDFLYSMPLNLEGVAFEELSGVTAEKFNDRDCYLFSGRFPEGKHLYTFYFDMETYALQGFRFSKDGSLDNGEYLYFEGEVQVGKIRLPAKRSWYYNANDGFLATDELLAWKKLK